MTNHNQFARMKFENGEILLINTQYITAYGYVKDQDKTAVSVLGEKSAVYFPGDQTKEIRLSFNCIGR